MRHQSAGEANPEDSQSRAKVDRVTLKTYEVLSPPVIYVNCIYVGDQIR